MSRRTRIRHSSTRFQLGRIHHNRYALSTTHFPESYSIFGSPIEMPTRFMPLIENNSINYVCKQAELLSNQCALFKLQPDQLKNAKSVNITVAGRIMDKVRQSLPNFIFIAGMACCCLMSLINPEGYRKKFFTRYAMVTKQYVQLSQLIGQLQNCENLIINIQDNQINEYKMKLLTAAIARSMGQKHSINENDSQPKKKKHVTIRNYCYFMKDIPTDNLLLPLAEFEHLNAIFVWQKIVVYSSGTRHGKIESQTQMFA